MSSIARAEDQDAVNAIITVHILEDDPGAAKKVQELVCGRNSRYSCSRSASLAECLIFLKQNPCDVLLLDPGLPDSNGLDTIASVRKKFPSLPIVVLAGLADEGTAVQAMSMDVQDYVIKEQLYPGLLSRSLHNAIDRKRSADALRQSEARARGDLAELQNLYDTALVGICVSDRNNRYLRVNRRLAELDGLAPEQIIGRTFREVIPRIAQQVEEVCSRVFRTGEPAENIEVHGKTRAKPDIEQYWLESVYPVLDAAGAVTSVVTIIQDITEQKRADEQLRQAREMSDALNRIHNVIHSTLDSDEILNRTVREGAEASGTEAASIGLFEQNWIVGKYAHNLGTEFVGTKFPYSDSEIVGIVKKTGRLVVVDDAVTDSRADPEIAAAFNIKSLIAAPLLRRGKVIGVLFFSRHREAKAFTGMQIDFVKKLAASVSLALENSQLFSAVAEREARYRALALSSSSVLWRTSADGQHVLEIRSPGSIEHPQPDRELGDWLELIHPDDRERTREAWIRAVANQEVFEIESRGRHPDGTFHHYISRAVPVIDGKGTVREWIGSSMDITGLKRVEEALRESENRLDLAARTANEGIWDWDVASGVVVTNDIYGDYFGKPPPGVPFVQWWREHIHEQDRDRVLSAIRELAEGRKQSVSIEYRFLCSSGQWCYVHDRAKVFAARDGRSARVVGVMIDITERKRVEDELRLSEERFREVFEHAPIGMIVADFQGRFQYVNNAFCRIVGYSREELLQPARSVDNLTHPEDLEETRRGIAKLLAREVPAFFNEKRYTRKDGTPIWVRVSSALRRDVQGKPVQLVGLVEDIRERKQVEQALRESEERFRTLADNIAQLAWMADSSGWVFWYNKRWFDYTGSTQEEMRGWGWQSALPPDHRERIARSYRDAVEKGLEWEDTVPIYGRDRSYRWFLCRATPIRNEQAKVARWFGTLTDITERRRMEEEVRHLAQHDALTGLPNRRLFSEIIRVEIAQARRNSRKLAILFLDLDRFKEINDTLGHDTGDELLKQTALRLRAVTRTSDTVARIGGDEFNILIPDISYPEYASEVAEKVLQEIRQPFAVKGHDLMVSTSIGISVFPDDSEEIDTLMRFADIAMYYAKEHGRNMHQFYNPAINTRSVERIRFENSLRRAIDGNEFRLHYQPLVSVRDRSVISAEVFLRWQHPERGLLLPGEFLPEAEEAGVMREIDDWVLKTAALQIRDWIAQGLSPVRLSINLSSVWFESRDLVPRISEIIRETGVPPGLLDLEISETVAMQDIENSIIRLEKLAELGASTSIHHFGTGYSSLNHLKRLPVRKLKMDNSFVRDIANDPGNRAILIAVLTLAHAMKLKVAAAGVETDGQLLFLRSIHCDEAQGYLFSHPVEPDAFREHVLAGR